MQTSVRLMALVVMAAIAASGCFKSSTSEASSESSSNSSSSISRSSSPSDKDEKESAYERDVRDYTVAHAASSDNLARFQQDLVEIAEGYGISDWEGDPTTHVAVGRGLARSGLRLSEADTLATALVQADRTRTGWILSGYRGARQE